MCLIKPVLAPSGVFKTLATYSGRQIKERAKNIKCILTNIDMKNIMASD